MIRGIDQRFKPEIWDEHAHVRHLGVHGFKTEFGPFSRQGVLDPPSLCEDSCPWWWFTKAFEETCRGFMSETHW